MKQKDFTREVLRIRKVVTFGEILLRLKTPNHQKIEQAQSFDVHYGGGEANVAVSLSQLGLQSSFVSKLPENTLGKSAKQFLQQNGVHTEHIVYGGERLGIYFLEKGFSIRPSAVLYDRKNSSFVTAKMEDFDWERIFEGADWFHVSGITVALSEELFLLTKTALKAAKEKGLTTSLDLNYRKALWSFETARVKMTELIPYVDVCIGIEPLQLLSETGDDIKDQFAQPLSVEDQKKIMTLLHEKYNLKYIATTFRTPLAVNRNKLKVMLSDGQAFYESEEVEVEIVDRVGTGDAFTAGIIYGLIQQKPPSSTVDFALGCFALKHTIEGDTNILETDTIVHYIENKQSFSIKR